MSARHRIDIEQQLVITEVWGECSDAEIANVYRALRADPAFVRTFDEVLDLRRVRTFVAAGSNVRDAGSGIYAPSASRARSHRLRW